MKRCFFSCVKLVLVAVLGVSSVTVEARRFLENGLVQIPRNQSVAVADFFEKFGSRLGLGPSDTMHPDRQPTSGATAEGCTSHRYTQHHDGIRVHGAAYSVIECNGRVRSGRGHILPNLQLDNTALKPANAVVRSYLTTRGLRSGVMASSAELVIIKPAGRRLQARKAWQLVIGSERVSVDAISAEAILVESLIERWADTPASGLSVYDGTVQFTASVDATGTPHRLRSESTPGGAIAVLRGNNIWNSTTGDFNFDSANDFASGSGSDFGGAYPNAVSALWGAQRALAYFNSEHGIIDLDGSGLPTRIFLNLAHGALPGGQCPVVLESATAAFVSYLPYGSPDLYTPYANIAGAIVLNSDPASPLFRAMVHTEIITHELTHAIAHFWFGGFGSGLESRALSESFADLLGVIGDGWIRNEPVDWIVGDAWRKPDAQGNAVIRRLYDPLNSNLPQPAVYLGPNWDFSTNPCTYDPHINSSVHSLVLYRLAAGDAANGIVAYPIDKLGRLVFRSLVGSLAGDEFDDAYINELNQAAVLFGEQTQSVASLANSWALAGSSWTPYVSTWQSIPADQASTVEPWPAELSWEALGEETQWQLQISSAPLFADQSKLIELDYSDNSGSTMVSLPAALRPHLMAGMNYYWRLRGREPMDSDWQDWRISRSFTTHDKPVSGLSPDTRRQKQHPWKLKLSWQPVAGAKAYEIQVATPEGSAPLSWDADTILVETIQGEGATETEIDVKVDRPHRWRIRAVSSDKDLPDDDPGKPDNVGQWQEATFITLLPRVRLVAPLANSPEYPWPVVHRWQPVIGAQTYLIDVTDCDAIYQYEDPANFKPCTTKNPLPTFFTHSIPHPEVELALDLVPEWLADKITIDWKVRVIGPEPWNEEGGDSIGDGRFIIDGDATVPVLVQPVAPGFSAYPPWACTPHGASAQFKWSDVQNATAYRFRLFKALGESDGLVSSESLGPIALAITTQPPASNSVTVVGDDLLPLLSAAKHVSYWWQVQATGPSGIPGLKSPDFAHLDIEPSVPDLITEDGHEFSASNPNLNPGDAHLEWSSDHAKFGAFTVKIYPGFGCTSSPYTRSFLGSTPGPNSGIVQGLDPAAKYSWRVFPDKGQECPPIESACRNFLAADFPPPPGPPSSIGGIHGNSTYGYPLENLIVEWSEVPDATVFKVQIRELTPNALGVEFVAGLPKASESIYAAACIVNPVQCLGLDVNNWIISVPLAPNNSGIDYEVRIRSCNYADNCGSFSNWLPFIYPVDFDTGDQF